MIRAAAERLTPLLRALPPETAHGLALAGLRLLPATAPGRDDGRLAVEAFGLHFPNPVGMAAGFDKDARVPDALLALGLGFVEVGTVTPLPQPGNARPRLFRLPADRALVNRFGFNSAGHAAAYGRLTSRRRRGGIVGVNLGANKDAPDRAADYVAGVLRFADVASYFTVNVSSPNTPRLRDLQQPRALDDLLARVLAARDGSAQRHGRVPVLLKIAPDLSEWDLDQVVAVARNRRVDGMIVANTTVSRPPELIDAAARQAGGLSGAPLFHLSTRMLARTFARVERQFPLVGVGGIDSAEAAYAKVLAGASLIQLYTALVFQGAGLIGSIKSGLLERLERDRYARLAEAVGASAAAFSGGNVAATSGP